MECCDEVMAMSPGTTEVDSQPEVKSMDVEPPETPGELTEPDGQMLSMEISPLSEEQSASKQDIKEYRAPTMDDECTEVKQMASDSPVEEVAVVEDRFRPVQEILSPLRP